MLKKDFKAKLLMFLMLSYSNLAFSAENVQQVNDKPVATILPEAGKLIDANGKSHQGLALECSGGKIGGTSYFSATNDLNVAIGSPVRIEISVDKEKPVTFTAIRKFNKQAPDALTSQSEDIDSAIHLVHKLEKTKQEVVVKVSNPAQNKTQSFTLKASDMPGVVKHFKTYCDVK